MFTPNQCTVRSLPFEMVADRGAETTVFMLARGHAQPLLPPDLQVTKQGVSFGTQLIDHITAAPSQTATCVAKGCRVQMHRASTAAGSPIAPVARAPRN